MQQIQTKHIVGIFLFFILLPLIFRGGANIDACTRAEDEFLPIQAKRLQSKIDAQHALWDKVRTDLEFQKHFDSEKRIWDLFDPIVDCYSRDRVGPAGTIFYWHLQTLQVTEAVGFAISTL
jgi:hypothetical protein